jgi:hypothetical protein
MNVENFWKQLKHGFLHNLLRPRLDQLIWIRGFTFERAKLTCIDLCVDFGAQVNLSHAHVNADPIDGKG